MRGRGVHFALVAVVSAAIVGMAGAESTAPQLLRTASYHGHVVVVARIAVGSTPRVVEVSRTVRLTGVGFLPSGLVLRERVSVLPGPSGVLRVVSRGRLAVGRYWVAVASVATGLTSCQPLTRGADCFEEWSNVLPLRVL